MPTNLISVKHNMRAGIWKEFNDWISICSMRPPIGGNGVLGNPLSIDYQSTINPLSIRGKIKHLFFPQFTKLKWSDLDKRCGFDNVETAFEWVTWRPGNCKVVYTANPIGLSLCSHCTFHVLWLAVPGFAVQLERVYFLSLKLVSRKCKYENSA